MSILWLVACGLVFPLPRASMVLFVLAGLAGFAAAGDYPDLAVWGVVSLLLAVGSYFGYRGKRRADRKEAERDALIRQLVASQQAAAAAMQGAQAIVYDVWATR